MPSQKPSQRITPQILPQLQEWYELNAKSGCTPAQLRATLMEAGSLLTCTTCHILRPHLDATMTNMNYSEEVDIGDAEYKRMSHFNDWLFKIQGKESTQASDGE